jgi:hypothetical protein
MFREEPGTIRIAGDAGRLWRCGTRQEGSTALNYFAHNFIQIHQTLRMTPAMAAGVTDRLWSVNDLVTLWEAYEQQKAA